MRFWNLWVLGIFFAFVVAAGPAQAQERDVERIARIHSLLTPRDVTSISAEDWQFLKTLDWPHLGPFNYVPDLRLRIESLWNHFSIHASSSVVFEAYAHLHGSEYPIIKRYLAFLARYHPSVLVKLADSKGMDSTIKHFAREWERRQTRPAHLASAEIWCHKSLDEAIRALAVRFPMPRQ